MQICDECDPEYAKKNCQTCVDCGECIEGYTDDELDITCGRCWSCFQNYPAELIV